MKGITLITLVFIGLNAYSNDTISQKKVIYDTLYSGVSEYSYITGYYDQDYKNIKSPNHATRYIVNGLLGLNVSEFIYKAQLDYNGNDTAMISITSYEDTIRIDTVSFVFACKSFDYPQNKKMQVHYITNNCHGNDDLVSERSHHRYNDSVVFSGIVVKDCCGLKTISASYIGDTIRIFEEYIYGGCACDCEFMYSFSLPLRGNERYIKYEDETVPLSSGVLERSSGINISPNPVNKTLHVDTDKAYDNAAIISMKGEKLKDCGTGRDIDVSYLSRGTYSLVLYKGNRVVGSARFVKE